MKTHLTLLLFLFATASMAQTIRRVNNNPGITGTNIYTTIQAAHDAATNGDIVYVEGSTVSYGSLTATKTLTIIGPGYFLADNLPTAPNSNTSQVDAVSFNTGSAGSAIFGCVVGSATIRVSNITFSRNVASSVSSSIVLGVTFGSLISGITISKNFGFNISEASPFQVSVTNNYLRSVSLADGTSSGSFSNNIIEPSRSGAWSGNFRFNGIALTNNILISNANVNPASLVNCTINNNIDARGVTNSTLFGTSDGNLGNVDRSLLFDGLAFSTDASMALKAGSPAIGAGVGGTDCGVFGGLEPYVLSGIPPYPQINKLIGSTSGNSTSPLSITISTKSNN